MITKFNFKDKTIKSYAIRKLTPRECFRLMGVRDGVIDTMQQPAEDGDMAVSASQQYKQAGNSIVVDVLKSIYSQLWYPAPRKEEAREQSLFADFFGEDLPAEPTDTHKGEKVFITTFSGYDSQLMAADALREEHPEFAWTCRGWSDIDKYACKMHDLVFPQFADCALGDITKIDWHAVKASLQGREVDMFTYSSPCQDISQAGKQMGLTEGSETRSALLWRVADAVEALRPKYLLQENVAALVSDKFMPDFRKWLQRLESLGYVNRWARLNAKDYGVPQNRDRVFCLSMRKDVAFDYQFPAPVKLEKRLADVLEEEVAERYFLKDNAVAKFLEANEKDECVFVQSDVPPGHENAMFLKTWYTRKCAELGVWEDPDHAAAARVLEGRRAELAEQFAVFKDKGAEAFGADFAEEYRRNMERKNEER